MSGVGVSGLLANLPGTVTPYPTQDPALELGGYRTVANATARDAIPANFRAVGMLVTLQSTGVTYELFGGLTNASWRVYVGAAFRGQYFVDPAFTGIQLGSASNPFTTIAAAFAFAVAAGVTNGVIYTTDITENVVLPTTGNWELRGITTEYFPAQTVLTGTVDLTTTANRNVVLADLEITGAVTGSAPVGLGCVVRVINCGLDAGLNLSGAGNQPWWVLFSGIANPGGSNGFGGYVDGAPTIVKGRVYAMFYSFLTAVTATTADADCILSFANCSLAANVSLGTSVAGRICAMAATASTITNLAIAFTGSAGSINLLSLDQLTNRSMAQFGVTVTSVAPLGFNNGVGSVKRTGLTGNLGVTQLANKDPSPMLVVRGALTLVTPGTSGNAVLNVTYTDSLGVSRTKAVTPALNVAGAAGDEVSGELVFTQDGSAIVQYSVTGVGTAGALNYTATVSVESAM